uniref:Uncharacterized protein n=1 Tax=Anguilla anguilla TaxID=7936 RepID=A0A0E9R0D6_ANGAN
MYRYYKFDKTNTCVWFVALLYQHMQLVLVPYCVLASSSIQLLMSKGFFLFTMCTFQRLECSTHNSFGQINP